MQKKGREGETAREASQDIQLWCTHWSGANAPPPVLWECSRYHFTWMYCFEIQFVTQPSSPGKELGCIPVGRERNMHLGGHVGTMGGAS